MGVIKKKDIQETGSVVLDSRPIEFEAEAELSPVVEEEVSAEEEEAVAPPESAPVEQISTKGSQILKSITDLGEVKTEAVKIVVEAEEKARRVFEDANRKIIEQRKRAEEEGRARGLQEGKKEVAARLEEAFRVLNEAIKQRKKIIKDAEAEILRLSIKVAEQIVRSEVSLHRDVCLNIISEAIGRVSDREQIIIKVSRDDLEQVKKYKDRIAGLVDGVKTFSVLEDSNVEAGGCIIETNLGYVDARISTKLNIIEDALFRVAESGKD
jgi:flagellar assembly protein FliH